ncbi:hypothetical protein FACS1894172_12890 [Spirochaetia bacterium]|nr:hypothetical protein FACS1894164_08140 [Spirochaetia bacterium]GHU33745.1 hypothetical protein FACS1894172_12890 [Spirochaetia bacterium]
MKGLGQNFDDFMREQGLYEEAKKLASKKLALTEASLDMVPESAAVIGAGEETWRVEIERV